MIRPFPVLALLIGAILTLGLAACNDGDDTNGSSATEVPASDEQTSENDSTVKVSDSASARFSDTVSLVKALTPSVVHITSEGEAVDQFGQSAQQRGVGTGFIIDEDGHIVTNNHVISIDGENAAESITVTLSNGRRYEAEVVGRDPRTDVAVLKIEATGLTPVKLGDSSDLQVGQDVVAIGNALDLPGGPTVTRGVVSALNRVIEEGTTSIPDAIQTDASINPGNSGGPLLNMDGEAVGITTAVIRGDAEGIGLVVSMDLVRPIVDELIVSGEVDRGFLGINVAPVNSSAAANCGVETSEGVLLYRVTAGSPAAEAGLQECDLMTALGSDEVKNTGDLFKSLTEHRAGDTVDVVYERNGQQETASVTLG